MIQLNWQKSRLLILGSYSFAILVSAVFVLTKPNQNKFPKSIVLDRWETIKTDKFNDEHKLTEGRKYKEEKHNLGMEIYFIPNSRGETLSLMNQYLELQLKPEDIAVKSDSQIGFYGLLNKNNQTYLDTCIHSSGKTAFTPQQFSQLANNNLSSRLLPWIFGLSDLRDWSCLWVNMSVSTDDVTQEEAAELLKQKLFTLLSEARFDK